MSAVLFAVALAVVAITGGGCMSSPVVGSTAEERLVRGGVFDVVAGLTVPAAPGAEGCGAQALATVLAFGDPAADAQSLADDLPWHDFGASPVDLLLETRDRGRSASVAHGSWEALAEFVRQGRPVLVMIDAAVEVRTITLRIPTGRVMHWAVVSGMARDGTRVLLAARDGRHHVVDRDDFLRRWSPSANCLVEVGAATALAGSEPAAPPSSGAGYP